MENFETSISEILEVDHFEMHNELSSFDAWDSLAVLGIISFVLNEYQVELSADEIVDSETITGLKELILSKINSNSKSD